MTAKQRVCDGCHRQYSYNGTTVLFGFCRGCERRMSDMKVDVDAERKLFLTVVRQAQFDAEGRGEVDQRLVRLAKRWLTTASRSFFHVCALAGLSRNQATLLQEQERGKWAR